MEMRVLKELVSLMETLSFQETADRMNISQSALSKHIQRVEEELGVSLFDRSTRSVALNQFGRVFYSYARQMVQLNEEAASAVATLRDRDFHRLRVAFSPIAASYGVVDVLSEFSRCHPELQLKLTETPRAISVLKASQFCAVSLTKRIGLWYFYYRLQAILRKNQHPERINLLRNKEVAMGKVNDLRSALEFLREIPGQLVETDVEVDPAAELSGVYRYVGAGGTVQRPTRVDGPAMVFHKIKGHPDASVAIGLMASRERVAKLFGCRKEELGHLLQKCAANPIMPEVTDAPAPVQEVIHRAEDPDFDLFRLIPAPTNTPLDAGPYITLGMCYATHPDTGLSDVTIHRMCIQSRDTLSIFLQPGSRHIGAMAERATLLNRPLPISVSIGVDPAISVTSCFEPPTTPLGFNELSIAGALRGEAVKLVPCVSVREHAIANAEYVIEGEILPGSNHVIEDQNTHTGFAMPEFPGYNGAASHECWLLKVRAVTHRNHPILQTCIGPSEEHVNMAGIPTEASILGMIDRALPGKVLNCYAHRSGGGKYLAVLQCRKTVHTDEGKQRQAALLAFSAFPELKHVILVDEDVDIFDTDDVLWAMNTRFQGDRDVITIPGVRCHPLDPSSNPAYAASIRDVGISTKTIFDCTVPFDLKERFRRAPFLEVDYTRWLQ